MAIGTDAAIEFFGTQDTLGTSSSAVANGAFSTAADLSTWVNDDDALTAKVTLLVNFTTAPTANSSIKLYARLLNIQGTNDQDVPDANYRHNPVGSFPLNDVTTAQYIPIIIDLINHYTSQSYEFYTENTSGQSMPTGWDLYITPTAVGPSA